MSEHAPTLVTLDRDHPDHPDNRVKVGHLVIGLVFLGAAGVWALGEAGVIGGFSVALVIPLVLVAAGALGLLAMVVGGVRNRRRTAAPAAPGETEAYRYDSDTYDTETDAHDTDTYSEEENR